MKNYLVDFDLSILKTIELKFEIKLRETQKWLRLS